MGALLQPMERAFPGKMIQGTFADSFGAHIVEVALVPGAEEPGARQRLPAGLCEQPPDRFEGAGGGGGVCAHDRRSIGIRGECATPGRFGRVAGLPAATRAPAPALTASEAGAMVRP